MNHAHEHTLCLLAIRSLFHQESRARLDALLRQPLDWTYLRQQAEIHRLSALIYATCLAHRERPLELPPVIFQSFQDAYQQTALQNALRTHHAHEILRECERRGIMVVTLKGMALLNTVYPDPAIRPMVDIDLLFHEENLSTAIEMLHELGYTPLTEHLSYLSRRHQRYESQLHEAYTRHSHHLAPFLKRVGAVSVCVEAHRHLFSNVSAGMVHTRVIPGSNPPMRVLTPTHGLAHLCGHLGKHVRSGKGPQCIWYADIGAYVTRYAPRIDWEEFQVFCQRHQLEDLALPVLRQAARLFDLVIPDEFQREMSSAQEIITELFAMTPPSEELVFWRNLRRYGWGKRGRLLWESLFPSAQFLQARYDIRHGWQIPGWYGLRVAKAVYRGPRLLKELLKRTWGEKIRHFESFGDVALFTHILLVRLLLPLILLLPLNRALRLLTPRRSIALSQDARAQCRKILLFANYWLTRPMFARSTTCLKRSLLLYYFLTRSNIPVRVQIGIKKEGGQLLGHSWLESSEPLIDERASGADFTVIYSSNEGRFDV